MAEEITVAELFAGVGGFRLGLEGHPSSNEETGFKVVFSNQWEPGEKAQWASKVYQKRFGSEGHTGNSIHDFTHPKEGISEITDHDLLVGGFPCQDYSVARTISGELGIKGEKGKLWVDIARIIRHKRPRPKIVLLENVPRLLNSPANARGLNFAIIINDLITMGYEVEWKVINAADYGMPQQRSRVFILAYRTPGSSSKITSVNGPGKYCISVPKTRNNMKRWFFRKEGEGWNCNTNSAFSYSFTSEGELSKSPNILSTKLEEYNSKKSPFENTGYAWRYRYGGKNPKPQEIRFWTTRSNAIYTGKRTVLKDVLEEKFDSKYEIDISRIDEWLYAKGSKNEFRLRKKDRPNVTQELLELYDLCLKAPFGERAKLWKENRSKFLAAIGENAFYQYVEGNMSFDKLEKPSRTMVTDEIGTTPSRMRHIIEYKKGKFRRIMPIEADRLNMFPSDWTKIDGIKDSRRGFLMGNALVVGIIERLRHPLRKLITERDL